jgi:hypothetical protein
MSLLTTNRNSVEKKNQITLQSASLVHRLVVVPSIMVMVVVLSCTRSESKRDNLESAISSDSSLNDKCNACSMESFFVKQASASDAEKLLIDGPVAIQFFNQVRLADKYEKENYDTLMKLLKMRHWSDRNVLYALKDQYFYFMVEIKPVLTKNSIKLIDSIAHNRLLEFRGSDGSIFVNADDYKGQDGVLFFTPGKKPLFWTADREEKYCRNSQGIVAQYFLCSTASKEITE